MNRRRSAAARTSGTAIAAIIEDGGDDNQMRRRPTKGRTACRCRGRCRTGSGSHQRFPSFAAADVGAGGLRRLLGPLALARSSAGARASPATSARRPRGLRRRRARSRGTARVRGRRRRARVGSSPQSGCPRRRTAVVRESCIIGWVKRMKISTSMTVGEAEREREAPSRPRRRGVQHDRGEDVDDLRRCRSCAARASSRPRPRR